MHIGKPMKTIYFVEGEHTLQHCNQISTRSSHSFYADDVLFVQEDSQVHDCNTILHTNIKFFLVCYEYARNASMKELTVY